MHRNSRYLLYKTVTFSEQFDTMITKIFETKGTYSLIPSYMALRNSIINSDVTMMSDFIW